MKLPAAAFALTFVGLALAGSTDQAPLFDQVTIHTDKGPRFVAIADVNHDGKPDLIVANADSGNVTVLLGDGRGHFQPTKGSPIAAGHLPNDIAVADMNGDGNLDLVIANHQSPYLKIGRAHV